MAMDMLAGAEAGPVTASPQCLRIVCSLIARQYTTAATGALLVAAQGRTAVLTVEPQELLV